MDSLTRNAHWQHIYQTKELNQVSWYQAVPQTSLSFLNTLNIPKTAKIIDVGGGDSFFVDNLLDLGYQDITVLDISASAIERAQKRLGERSKQVQWIVSDIINFEPTEIYDFWHDRAAFHFLTSEDDIKTYVSTAQHCIAKAGHLVIGTFSESGPLKCSGIEIKQYSEDSMEQQFDPFFEKLDCQTFDHTTPFNTTQNFLFCSFKKLGN